MPASSERQMPPLADNLKTLELLSERKQGSGQAVNASIEVDDDSQEMPQPGESEAVAQVVETVEVEFQPSESCYTLGPFRDKEIMEQLRDSLSQQVADVSMRKRTESEKHRYWVYIPAAGGRKGAKRVAQQLRDRQVKDFYIVLKGEQRNSVSLGHFREQKHANRRLKRINDLGFGVELKVVYRDYDVYWLDYSVIASEQGPSFEVAEYQSEGVSQISRECQSRG